MALLNRNDQDRAVAAPLRLQFGGETREVKPLTIRRSREWKEQLVAVVGFLGSLDLDFYTTDPAKPDEKKLDLAAVQRMVAAAAQQAPDKIADVVFAYLKIADPSLDRTWFDETATWQDVTDALLRMVEVTFPFYWKLGDLMVITRALGA